MPEETSTLARRASRPEAYAWMAASACGFAVMSFCAHVASERVHWSMAAAARSLVGAAVAYGVARMRGASVRVVDRRGIWWRSLWGTSAMLLTFFALGTRLPLGDAVTLLNLAPVFLALLSPWLLGERTGKRVVVALALSVAGIVLILRPSLVTGAGELLGAAAAVTASLCACFAYTMLRRMGPGESPEAIALHFSLVAAAVLTAIALLHLSVPDARSLALMLGAGAAAGFAQLAMTRAYALERAARVGGLSYLAIVVSTLLGAVVLHEEPPGRAIAGMALVVAGGLVVTVVGLREAQRAAKSG
jgi:drug/metabolite transporter (DMT)-like permease